MKMMISTHADGAAIAARSQRQSSPSAVAQVAASAAMLVALVFTLEPAQAQFTQQGAPLVGSYDRPAG